MVRHGTYNGNDLDLYMYRHSTIFVVWNVNDQNIIFFVFGGEKQMETYVRQYVSKERCENKKNMFVVILWYSWYSITVLLV